MSEPNLEVEFSRVIEQSFYESPDVLLPFADKISEWEERLNQIDPDDQNAIWALMEEAENDLDQLWPYMHQNVLMVGNILGLAAYTDEDDGTPYIAFKEVMGSGIEGYSLGFKCTELPENIKPGFSICHISQQPEVPIGDKAMLVPILFSRPGHVAITPADEPRVEMLRSIRTDFMADIDMSLQLTDSLSEQLQYLSEIEIPEIDIAGDFHFEYCKHINKELDFAQTLPYLIRGNKVGFRQDTSDKLQVMNIKDDEYFAFVHNISVIPLVKSDTKETIHKFALEITVVIDGAQTMPLTIPLSKDIRVNSYEPSNVWIPEE